MKSLKIMYLKYELQALPHWFYPRSFEKKEVLLEVFEAVDQGIKCQ